VKIFIRKRMSQVKVMGLFCGLCVLTVITTLTEGAEIDRTAADQEQIARDGNSKLKGAWVHCRLAKPPERSGIKVLPGSPYAKKMKKNIALDTEAKPKRKQRE